MFPYTMSKARKLPLSSLNDYLTCKLCRGYYIDATTIIECLHSFCRSCIVKYLEKNKYCPICDVQVHKTKPLINIRQDKILQSCVYKLVPRLFQNEMLRRKSFYASHPEEKKNLDVEELGEANYQHILAPDENICVALNYKDSPLTPRYLQCSAAVSIFHLQKLIRSKYDLSFSHRIDIFHEDDVLKSYLTLIDVAYGSLWRRKGPLELTYRIYESTLNSANLDINLTSDDNEIANNLNNNNASNDWKEVQIQISENGEMSVTGIQDCLELLDKMDDNSIKSTEKPNKKDNIASTDDKIKNHFSKITKVELNQPPTTNNSTDVIMTVTDSLSLPVVTLTASEIRELSKVEEAARTQLSEAIIVPPPPKKPKKDLPDLKLIASKSQKKNGAKSLVDIPPETSKNNSESIAQTSSSSTAVTVSKPVNVTSVTVIPACSSQPVVTMTSSESSTSSATTNSLVVTTKTVTNVMTTSANLNKTTLSNVKTSNSSVSVLNTSVTPSINSSKLSTNVTQSKLIVPAVTTTSVQSISSNVNTTTTASMSSSKRKHPSSLDNVATTSSDQATVQKLPKPTILNHTLGMQKSLNLSKNHPLTTKHQKAIETASAKAGNVFLNTATTTVNQMPTNTNKWNTPLKTYGASINVPKVQISQVNKQPITSSGIYSSNIMSNQSSSAIVATTTSSSSAILDNKVAQQQTSLDNNMLMIKSKASTPIGYKTLKDPPKTWNPTLQPMHHKIGGAAGVGQQGLNTGKAGDLKNVRPAKFFKMRNNMPRYLGCPNSGVKPMFHVHVSPEKEKDASNSLENVPQTSQTNQTTNTTATITVTNAHLTSTISPSTPSTITTVQPSSVIPPQQPVKSIPDQQHIRKHSIVKIDPKTLKPISEKAPECSNLSTKSSSVGLGSGGVNKSLGSGGEQVQKGGVGGLRNIREAAGQLSGNYDSREQQTRSPLVQTDQSTTTTTTSSSRSGQTSQSTTSSSNLNLRINTTSVSITNPLKKSPHSPKKSTSPPNHQSKSNQKTPPPTTSPVISPSSGKPPPLNNQQSLPYTPSNPFIPNPLASPTLNPNQFNLLTAAVAAGFHGYDPRYHHHHHHLPYPHPHQLFQPRLPPFAPAPNWWTGGVIGGAGGQRGEQQIPLSSSANRNSSPRGLIWNGPSTENQVCSPKEAKTATSANIDSKNTRLDITLPRSSHKKVVDTIPTTGVNYKSVSCKETIIKDSAHERKDDNKSTNKQQICASTKPLLPKSKTLSEADEKNKSSTPERIDVVNKVVDRKSTSETQSAEKIEKVSSQKSTASSDTPKENVVLAV